jgi:CTP synthase
MVWDLGEHNRDSFNFSALFSRCRRIKTKPTQHSVKTLMESGIKADILVCRTEHEISDEIRNKLALFCNVKRSSHSVYRCSNYL